MNELSSNNTVRPKLSLAKRSREGGTEVAALAMAVGRDI
jgi:hypothetical protein